MTPGTYLRLRREAADVTTDEVDGIEAARLWQIEADQADITGREIVALGRCVDFDVFVLLRLTGGSESEEICRCCGCTFDDPCDPPCDWAAPGLCDNPDCLAKAQAAA